MLLYILISTLSVLVAGYVLPGIKVENVTTAVVVAVVLGLINAFIRPIVLLLTLPINILTLGLFTFVIMALMVMLTSAIVPGFTVASFWWAMGFALLFSIINGFLSQAI